MSRIGKLPIEIPSGVTITITDASIDVSGSYGNLKQFTMQGINVVQEDNKIIVTRDSDEKVHRSKHGLMRTLVANMIIGVSKGSEKKLEVNGIGFKVNLQGNNLKMSLGFSHDVVYTLPSDVAAKIEQNIITLTSHDKQKLGQVAAEIRSLKKPEPYKGKGIKYVGERILRKSGKSGKDK